MEEEFRLYELFRIGVNKMLFKNRRNYGRCFISDKAYTSCGLIAHFVTQATVLEPRV